MTTVFVPLEPVSVPRPRTSFLLPATLLRAALLQDHTVYSDLAPEGVPHYELLPLLRELEGAEAKNVSEHFVGETKSFRNMAGSFMEQTLERLMESGAGQVYWRSCAQTIDSGLLAVNRSWAPAFMNCYENETFCCACPNGHEVFRSVGCCLSRAMKEDTDP